jgi:hypothetical protein
VLLVLFAIPGADALAAGHTPKTGTPSSQSDKPAPAQGADSYDPAATSMTVVPSAKGATVRVVANDSSDAKQIGLVRASLKRQADDAGAGIFPTPPKARDNSTPGLAALQAAPPGQILAQYFEVRGGAEIRYAAEDPMLVRALNAWVNAQQDMLAAASAAPAAQTAR